MTTIEINNDEQQLQLQIRKVLSSAKSKIAHSVNSTVVNAYWLVGKYIVEFEQEGNARAEYGKGLLKRLSAALTPDFGKGFSVTNLQFMRLLYMRIQNYESLPHNLSWTHYIALMKVKDDTAMRFTLPEDKQQIFASQYLTNMPSEEELRDLINESRKEELE